MSKTRYLISLKPIEDYFFGGEKTFGSDRKGQSYFVKSNYYPQQTSLLGLVRYMLLKQNGALPLKQNIDKANVLIGKKSFNTNIEKEKQEFGVINEISPLMMKRGDVLYRFEHQLAQLKLTFEDGVKMLTNELKNKVPVLNGYDPKKDYESYVIDSNDNTVPFSKIFMPVEKIGIMKNNPNKTAQENRDSLTDDDAFFKQTYYKLLNDFEFAFMLTLDDKYDFGGHQLDTKFENCISGLGGEQKQFIIKIKKAEEESVEKIFQSNARPNRLTLLSDAYVQESIYDLCDFALSDTQDFRTVEQSFDGNKFRRFSYKLNIMKRGSVLYFEDKNQKAIESLFKSVTNYYNIGFNQYIIENN